MADYFSDKAYPEKDRIVSYLKSGKKTYSATSRAKDRFTGDVIPGEHCGMTDGEYTWNSELIHYVEKYNLRLPDEFISKALRV